MAEPNDREAPAGGTSQLPRLVPADYCDPVVEFYKTDVDRTLLRENLKLSIEERVRKAMSFHQSVERWCGAAAGKPEGSARKERT